MSTPAVNQRRIYDGFAKIASQLGGDYEVYDFTLFYPVQPGISQRTIPASFTADTNFAAPLKYNKAPWIGYMDGDLVSQFSILVGPYGTFYIGDKQPMVPLQAVRCNKTISIGRVVYSTEGPIEEIVVNYAESIPAFFQFARSEVQRPVGLAAQTLGRAITHWTAFIPAPQGTLKQDDVITDEDGIKYMLDSPDFTNMGYVCHVRLASI